jgi:hypothetical protein
MFRINRTTAGLMVLALSGFAVGAGDDRDLQPVRPSGQFNINEEREYYGSRDSGVYALSPDGQTAATATRGPVMLFDLVKRKKANQPRTLTSDERNFSSMALAFSPDGKTIAGVSPDQYGSQDPAIHFWDVASGKDVRQLENDQPFFSLAFSPDGKLLALGGQGRIEIWDAATGDEVRVIPGQEQIQYQLLAFAPDGKTLASAGSGNVIQLWETATGKERHQIRLGREEPQPNIRRFGRMEESTAGALGFSADGKVLAVGGIDNAIRLWDLQSGRELPPLTGHRAAVRGLVFTADGKQLISLDGGGLRMAWNVGRIIQSAPGKLAGLSDGEFDELWDDLAETDAFRTYRAVKHLAGDPTRALALLGRRVKPVPAGDAPRLAQLVADVQSPNAGVRRKAMTALRKEGEAALGALTELSEEQRQNRAVMVLLVKLDAQFATPDRQRALQTVDVLEQIGTPEARQFLEKLAKGAPGTRLTKAAKTALERLKDSSDKGSAMPGNAEALWNDLAGEDAAAAYRAIRGLAALPKEAMPFFKAHLKPVVAVDAKRIEQMIADLDSNDFSMREKATADLEELGELAKPALKKTLKGDVSLDTKKRIERLLGRLTAGQAPSPKMLRTLRAVEALERLDTDEARQLLQALAKGAAEARLTRDAKDALARLGKKPAMR